MIEQNIRSLIDKYKEELARQTQIFNEQSRCQDYQAVADATARTSMCETFIEDLESLIEETRSDEERELDTEDNWFEPMNAIEDRVEEYIRSKTPSDRVLVIYSHYKYDENDDIVDNLDEIAVKGKCVFRHKDDYGMWISHLCENPTWIHVAYLFNCALNLFPDTDHVFLEGVKKVRETEDGIAIYEFSTGS